jgi:hypothetical protein
MATVAGVTVANLYYSQPILAEIAAFGTAGGSSSFGWS